MRIALKAHSTAQHKATALIYVNAYGRVIFLTVVVVGVALVLGDKRASKAKQV